MAVGKAPAKLKLSPSLPLQTLTLLGLLLLPLFNSSPSQAVDPSSLPSRRGFFAFQKGTTQIPNCSELSSISDCAAQKPHCRWCRSESLDDTCFGAGEARRLPPQVFICN